VGKPNLFITGFPKAGTTSLYYYMDKHKEIYCNPFIKEPRFFSSDYLGREDRRFSRNIVRSEEKYLALFRYSGNQKYIVDGSVYYSYFQGIAPRIKEFSPKAKIIMCIRNPVDRFRSHCMMERRDTNRNDSFSDFFRNPELKSRISLLKSGIYGQSIEEYYNTFGRKNVYVAVFDDLITDSTKYYSGICDFLGINYESAENIKINESGIQKNRFVINIIRLLKGIIPGFITRRIRFRTKVRLNSFFYKTPLIENDPIPEELRNDLMEYYKEDIKRTGNLIGRDLSGWLL